jgi:hypothetical protein
MTTLYRNVLAKYDWAQKRVRDFETAVEGFRLENTHAIRRKLDDQTGDLVYYVESVPAIPEELAFMLGDAIHNLRGTLDHLAYALVSATGVVPQKNASFPISDTAKDFPALARGKIPGVREYCYHLLDRIQPYKGGWGHHLWQLHQLDIVDKHRLVLAIATVPVGRSMTPRERAAFGSRRAIIGPTAHYFQQMIFGGASNISPVVPMKAGYELGRFPALEDYENLGFAFDVAIDEVGIVTAMPTSLLLGSFASEILRVIEDFALCL